MSRILGTFNVLSNELFDVSQEIVLITGGGTGIGRSLAGVLVENGASVAIAGRNDEVLQEARDAFAGMRGRALCIETDVREDASVAAAFDAVESTWGPVSVLVNNAGSASHENARRLTREAFREVLSVNVESAFVVAQQAAERMIKAEMQGSIINVGSMLCDASVRHALAYGASKAAVGHLTRTLALEWAKYGIRVNELRPGWFPTEMTAPVLKGAGAAVLARQNPMQRLGRLEASGDLAGAVLLLASQASRYMTGSAITVDGGHSLIQ